MRTKVEHSKTTGKELIIAYPQEGSDMTVGLGFTRPELYDLYVQIRVHLGLPVGDLLTECVTSVPCEECPDADGCSRVNKGRK
jgi:hypothetical protein